jgi:hypothetical protein
MVTRRTGPLAFDSTMPESTKAFFVALRKFGQTVHAARKENSTAYRKVLEDRDLTEPARERRRAELRAKAGDPIELAAKELEIARAATLRAIDAAVEKYAGRRPFDLEPIDVAKLSEDQRVLVRATREAAAQTARLREALVEQKLDRDLDRALLDPSGAAMLGLYRRLLDRGDPELLFVLERHGLERVRAEGNAAQTASLETTLEAGRESRLPDDAKRLLDYRDAVDEAHPLALAVLGDARSERFLSEGNLPSMMTAQVYLGSYLSGTD